MIPRELEIRILRLHHVEKWPIETIAREIGVHHGVVRRVLDQGSEPRKRSRRRRLVDPYLPFIEQTLASYPRIAASRLLDMVRTRGYPGGSSQFRAVIATLRPRRTPEAYLRLRTLPCEVAQVDWGHFGRLQVGRASRPLTAFLMVLSYSRAIFLRFYLSQSPGNFLHGHEAAFAWVGGVARCSKYDNLKSVVLERVGNAIRFQPQFLEFAAHGRFEPRRWRSREATRRGGSRGPCVLSALGSFRHAASVASTISTARPSTGVRRSRWRGSGQRTRDELLPTPGAKRRTNSSPCPMHPFPARIASK